MRHHYLRPLAGIPGAAAGVFLTFVPLWGLWRGGDFGAAAWKDAAPWILTGLLLLLSKRGLSVAKDTRDIRVWYGLGFTRFLVLPLWRAPRREFRRVFVRKVEGRPPRSGPVRQSAVFLEDVDEKWIEAGRTWTRGGAVRLAERLCRQTGLPLA